MCGLELKIQLFVIIETAPYLHLEIGSFNLPDICVPFVIKKSSYFFGVDLEVNYK